MSHSLEAEQYRTRPWGPYSWRIVPPASPILTDEVVVFVHGYNVDRKSATSEYERLREDLRELAGRDSRLTILELFWPGYLSKGVAPDEQSVFSPATYPFHVRRVPAIGQGLASFLEPLRGLSGEPLRIVIVAHSLGCRLVLEALAQFTPNQRRRFSGMCLMAAAVPQHHLADQLDRLRQAATIPVKRVVLYSENDSILRRYFPGGQTLAGDGFFPEAVGLRGSPKDYWRGPNTETHDTGLDHGDYFRGATALSNGPSQSAAAIGGMLGYPAARRPPAHRMPASRPFEAPAPRVQHLVEHDIVRRTLR